MCTRAIISWMALFFDDPHHNESQKLHRYRSNVGPIKPLHEFLAASTGLRSPTP